MRAAQPREAGHGQHDRVEARPRAACAAACRRCRAGPRCRGRAASRGAGRGGAGWWCPRAHRRAALRAAGPTTRSSASRGSARSSTATRPRPSGSTVGTSFRLCTARSTSPASIASSISFRKAPLPPTDSSRRSCIRSPVVVMTRGGRSCPSALEPVLDVLRLPQREHRSSRTDTDSGSTPQRSWRDPAPSASACVVAVLAGFLQVDRGRVQQLVDDGRWWRPRGPLLLGRRARPSRAARLGSSARRSRRRAGAASPARGTTSSDLRPVEELAHLLARRWPRRGGLLRRSRRLASATFCRSSMS